MNWIENSINGRHASSASAVNAYWIRVGGLVVGEIFTAHGDCDTLLEETIYQNP